MQPDVPFRRGFLVRRLSILPDATSRRHGANALVAAETAGGYRLDGVMPWVTAAPRADLFVTGVRTTEDGGHA